MTTSPFRLIGPLSVEVSAVQFDGTSVSTCNDQPQHAQGFGVYLRNPLALHVLDFTPTAPELMTGDKFVTLREAHGFAFRYAGALASHLGIEVVSSLVEAATYWPSRFAIQPERDWNAADLADTGTAFGPCEDSEATQWGVYELSVAKDGRPVHGTSELVEDYPTREAAQAAVDALERGQPLPDPVWPATAAPARVEGVGTIDQFGVMAGYGPDGDGTMLPCLFDTYEEAEQEATSRSNAPGRWACVVQVMGDGKQVHYKPHALPASMTFYVASHSDDNGLHWSTLLWWDGADSRNDLLELVEDEALQAGIKPVEISFAGPFTLGEAR